MHAVRIHFEMASHNTRSDSPRHSSTSLATSALNTPNRVREMLRRTRTRASSSSRRPQESPRAQATDTTIYAVTQKELLSSGHACSSRGLETPIQSHRRTFGHTAHSVTDTASLTRNKTIGSDQDLVARMDVIGACCTLSFSKWITVGWNILLDLALHFRDHLLLVTFRQ